MDLEKNKQRLEILAAEVEELKNSGGGETVDAYTKEEADNKFAEKATTYTKTEVDEAIASAAGGDVIVSDDNVKTKNAGLGSGILIGNEAGFNSTAAYEPQIAIGTRAGITKPQSDAYPIAIGYQASGKGSDIVIGSYSINYGTDTNNVLIGQKVGARGSQGVGIGANAKTYINTVSIGVSAGGINATNGVYVGSNCTPKNPVVSAYGQISVGAANITDGSFSMCLGHQLKANEEQVILGRYNVESNDQDYFAVGNGADDNTRSNLFSFSNNLFYCGNDTTGYDLRYFAPADETLTNGGTISATALANANKHVPLSFNAHMCYYSYEDTNNVYYTSTRLNGTSLHTNIIAINKTTGVATFNEFD